MSVDVQEQHFFQAVCGQCGWHTREYTNKPTVKRFADAHEKVCPNPPPPRYGAVMTCGCWWHATPGASVGITTERCPAHGLVQMTAANVAEPEGEALDRSWTRGSSSPTEGDATCE